METARCKAFLSAVETGSFTAAAEKLGYTPSGVSQLVSALEKELDLTLLDRTRKGVRPTRDGERFLPTIRAFLSQEASLYELASEIRGLATGTVTITCFPSVATYWLPEVIKQFELDYPGIEIRLREGIRQEIFERLDQGTADMGFLTYAGPMDYEWIPLAEDRMIAVLPEDHPLAGADAYPIGRCSEEDFIMPELGHDVDVVNLLKDHGVDPKIKFSTVENPTALAMIRSGLGMSIMNELCTTNWKDRLIKLPLDPPVDLTFGIAIPSIEGASPAAARFLDYAVRMLSRAE